MNDILFDNVLLLLGKDKESLADSERGLISFAIQEATSKVKNYCNIVEIPDGLVTTTVRLAVDLYRAEGYGNEEKPKSVTSVRRGDVSTNFADDSKGESIDTDFISKYRPQLNAFRKLRW